MPWPTDAQATAAGVAGWWWCLARHDDGRPTWFAVVQSAAHPSGLVELDEPAAAAAVGEDTVCLARYGADGSPEDVVGLELGAPWTPDAPPLWFVELPEPDATVPASNLLAFSGHGVPTGTLLDATRLGATGVRTEDQLAAVRWYPATGEIDQLYVAPTWRRRRVGTALVIAGGTLSRARGEAGWWGDGQRTAAGDRWLQASTFRERGAPLTHLMPPMTPFDER